MRDKKKKKKKKNKSVSKNERKAERKTERKTEKIKEIKQVSEKKNKKKKKPKGERIHYDVRERALLFLFPHLSNSSNSVVIHFHWKKRVGICVDLTETGAL